MAIDLTRSGRVSWFEAYRSPVTLPLMNGKWTKVPNVCGGKLSWKFYSTLKTSGSIDVVDSHPCTNCYVRVYYCMALDGKEERDLLGTYYAQPKGGTYHNGRFSGSITLTSTLKRYDDLRLTKDTKIADMGKNPLEQFHAAMKIFGGEYVIDGSITKGTTRRWARYAEFGTKAISVLQEIADTSYGHLGVDRYGRLHLYGMDRQMSGHEVKGIMPLDVPEFDDDNFGIPNKVAVRHVERIPQSGGTTREKVWIGNASLASSSPASAANVGRQIVETYDVSDMDADTITQAVMDAKAKNNLARNQDKGWKYRVRTPYTRVELEQAVYMDTSFASDMSKHSSGGNSLSGKVVEIDMSLDGPMGVTTLIVSHSSGTLPTAW